jgi:hypothetical protein
MAASTDVTFWAYNWWLMNNPYKTHFTKQDIVKAARMFAAANSTEITSATDPGGTYTDVEWPDQAGASSITAVGNSSTYVANVNGTETSIVNWELVDEASRKTLEQAWWPERPA